VNRTANVRASDDADVEALVISRNTLLALVGQTMADSNRVSKNFDFLRQSGLAVSLAPSEVVKVAHNMRQIRVRFQRIRAYQMTRSHD
jgi:hypothetical protein